MDSNLDPIASVLVDAPDYQGLMPFDLVASGPADDLLVVGEVANTVEEGYIAAVSKDGAIRWGRVCPANTTNPYPTRIHYAVLAMDDNSIVVSGQDAAEGLTIAYTDSTGAGFCEQEALTLTVADRTCEPNNNPPVRSAAGITDSLRDFLSAFVNIDPRTPICGQLPTDDGTGVSLPGSIKEVAHIYPQPADGVLTIACVQSWKGGSVRVLNTLGQAVYEAALPAAEIRISTAQWPAGQYLVRIREAGGSVYSTRVVVVAH